MIKIKYIEYDLKQNDRVKHLFSVKLRKCYNVIDYNYGNWGKMKHSWSKILLKLKVLQISI